MNTTLKYLLFLTSSVHQNILKIWITETYKHYIIHWEVITRKKCFKMEYIEHIFQGQFKNRSEYSVVVCMDQTTYCDYQMNEPFP